MRQNSCNFRFSEETWIPLIVSYLFGFPSTCLVCVDRALNERYERERGSVEREREMEREMERERDGERERERERWREYTGNVKAYNLFRNPGATMPERRSALGCGRR